MRKAKCLATSFVGEEIYIVKLAHTVVGSIQVEVK